MRYYQLGIIFLLIGIVGITSVWAAPARRWARPALTSTFATSADGTVFVVAGGFSNVMLYHTGEEMPLRMQGCRPIGISRLAISGNGQTIAAGYIDGNISLWQASDGRLLRTMQTNKQQIISLCLAPDGATVITSDVSEPIARAWQVSTGKVLFTLSGHNGPVQDIAYTPDGSTIATASVDEMVRLWRARDGVALRELVGHTSAVSRVAFSPNGIYMATTSQDGMLFLWHVASGVIRNTWPGQFECIAFTDDSRAVLAIERNPPRIQLRRYDFELGPAVSMLLNPDIDYTACGLLSESRVLTSSMDGSLCVLRSRDGALQQTLSGESPKLITAVVSPDNSKIAVAGADHSVRLLHASDGAEIKAFTDLEDSVGAIAYSQERNLLAAGVGNTVMVWDVATGTRRFSLNGHQKAVSALAFSATGNRLVTADRDRAICVWDVTNGQQLCELGQQDSIKSVTFGSDENSLVTVGTDMNMYHWRISDWSLIRTIPLQTAMDTKFADMPFSLYGVSISADRRYLVTGNDGLIRIWSAKDGALVSCYHGGLSGSVSGVAISTKVSLAAGAGLDNRSVEWFPLAGGEVSGALTGFSGSVRNMAFASDGSFLLTAGDDGLALWGGLQ